MTTDFFPFLKQLITAPGLSGYEAPVRELIRSAWTPLTDDLQVSRLGSLHGLQRGAAAEPRPSVMIAAHMDAIGLMVTAIDAGYLRFTEIGGIDPRVLPGQLVTVHGREPLPGVIVQPPARLLPEGASSGTVAMNYLLIDTGLLSADVRRNVRVGDLVSFAQEPLELKGETLSGHSLDNRASVAVVTVCLDELKSRPHAWDVWAVASSQEEETLGGAQTSAFQLDPALAVVVDVTFAASPGCPSHKTYPLDKGPTIGWGPNAHPYLFKTIRETAERLEIPYSIEVMPRHSGTDAYAIQVTSQGIPCVVIGIPLRYMHTPVEIVALKDIRRAGRLIVDFIANLSSDFMNQMSWEE